MSSTGFQPDGGAFNERKAGWCTIQFNAFLQNKLWTQRIKGGNTAEFYEKEGTRPKSEILKQLHPDITNIVWRFGRVHHYVDYSRFKHLKLIKREGVQIPKKHDEYGMTLRAVK